MSADCGASRCASAHERRLAERGHQFPRSDGCHLVWRRFATHHRQSRARHADARAAERDVALAAQAIHRFLQKVCSHLLYSSLLFYHYYLKLCEWNFKCKLAYCLFQELWTPAVPRSLREASRQVRADAKQHEGLRGGDGAALSHPDLCAPPGSVGPSLRGAREDATGALRDGARRFRGAAAVSRLDARRGQQRLAVHDWRSLTPLWINWPPLPPPPIPLCPQYLSIHSFFSFILSNHSWAGLTTSEEQDQLSRLERQLKRRLAVGTQVSVAQLLTDLKRQRPGDHAAANAAERQLERVLQLMLRRGEVQFRMQRKIIFRLKWIAFLSVSDHSLRPFLTFSLSWFIQLHFISQCISIFPNQTRNRSFQSFTPSALNESNLHHGTKSLSLFLLLIQASLDSYAMKNKML